LVQHDEPDGVHVDGPIRVVWRSDLDHEVSDVARSAIVGRDETTLIDTTDGEHERTINSASLVSIAPDE
jgi:hypothetical protein